MGNNNACDAYINDSCKPQTNRQEKEEKSNEQKINQEAINKQKESLNDNIDDLVSKEGYFSEITFYTKDISDRLSVAQRVACTTGCTFGATMGDHPMHMILSLKCQSGDFTLFYLTEFNSSGVVLEMKNEASLRRCLNKRGYRDNGTHNIVNTDNKTYGKITEIATWIKYWDDNTKYDTLNCNCIDYGVRLAKNCGIQYEQFNAILPNVIKTREMFLNIGKCIVIASS